MSSDLAAGNVPGTGAGRDVDPATGHRALIASDFGHGGRQGAYGQPGSGSLDGSRLAGFVRQNALLFAGIMIVVLGLAALYTMRQTPVYETKASVMLDQRKKQVVQGQEEVVSQLPSDSSVVDTEVQILSSSGMAYQVARKARLLADVPVERMTRSQQEQASAAIRDILEHRSIARVGLTYLIEIQYSAADPEVAQRMANLYARAYLDSQVAVRAQENERVQAHLQDEIGRLRGQVKAADEAVASYKAQAGLNGNTAAGTLTEQEISSYNQTLAVARAQSAEDSQRLAAARSQIARGVDRLGDLNASGMQQLRTQQVAASALVAQLASRYGPNHPDLITARQQLADINRSIGGEGNRVLASLQAQSQASAGRAAQIEAKLNATQGELARADRDSVRLRELQSQLAAPQALLDAYMARFSQISTQIGTEQPDARITSLAPLPDEPSSPSWRLNLALATGLGLILFLIVALLKQVFSVGVGSPEEVEGMFGTEFLAAIPRVRGADDMALINQVVETPTSAYSEGLRALSASIFVGTHAYPKVVSITSAQAAEGKTTTAIALGRSLALRGRRVLIVDCDLQSPTFHSRYGIGHGGPGLVQAMQGAVGLGDCLVPDGMTQASFLVVGDDIAPGQSFDHDALVRFIADARAAFDVVLLDLPPVLQVADARVIAAASDATVLLTRWKHTSRQAIEYALSTLSRAGATVLGVVLTEVPASSEMMMGGYNENANARLIPAAA
ncbi:GumC family protein [Novosphingobium lentum]|uniref:GumC family protein n=1 Tax=Novosphingobium lentum TaxID=145287 RepID=UPI0014706EA3|nr:polysaccharide biosynthesis tyrosine autokinase [Novosphingobium lentum]